MLLGASGAFCQAVWKMMARAIFQLPIIFFQLTDYPSKERYKATQP